jgi:Protein of unknown function (DUF3611)
MRFWIVLITRYSHITKFHIVKSRVLAGYTRVTGARDPNRPAPQRGSRAMNRMRRSGHRSMMDRRLLSMWMLLLLPCCAWPAATAFPLQSKVVAFIPYGSSSSNGIAPRPANVLVKSENQTQRRRPRYERGGRHAYQQRLVRRQGMGDDDDEYIEPLIQAASPGSLSPLVRRVAWTSWWCQVILSTVATVIVVFCRQVQRAHLSTSIAPLWLSASGLLTSAASILWTWATTRLARRLTTTTSLSQATNWLTRTVQVGVRLNLLGLALHLLAAEQIVGVLSIKVLTDRNVAALTTSSIQPLDILLVQANTNASLSHFLSLVALLYLQQETHRRFKPQLSEQ